MKEMKRQGLIIKTNYREGEEIGQIFYLQKPSFDDQKKKTVEKSNTE